MTTYTTVIMQISQNRLKSRLKDFHIRLKYLTIVDYKVMLTTRPYSITGRSRLQIC